MESKIKALKVTELRELLTASQTTFPAKALKPELIQKVLASQAALQIYTTKNPDSSAPQHKAEELVPLSAQAPAFTPAAPVATLTTAETPVSVRVKHDSPPASSTTSTLSSTDTAQPTPATATPAPLTAEAKAEADAADLAARKKRAERFGVPLVEPKAPAPPKAARIAPAAAKTKPTTVAATLPDDPEKIKARAGRFKDAPLSAAIVDAPLPAATIPTTTTTTTTTTRRVAIPTSLNAALGTGSRRGTKRAAPAIVEEVDAEELARRKKRAERFATSTTA